jgi:hypothetical protein
MNLGNDTQQADFSDPANFHVPAAISAFSGFFDIFLENSSKINGYESWLL